MSEIKLYNKKKLANLKRKWRDNIAFSSSPNLLYRKKTSRFNVPYNIIFIFSLFFAFMSKY